MVHEITNIDIFTNVLSKNDNMKFNTVCRIESNQEIQNNLLDLMTVYRIK